MMDFYTVLDQVVNLLRSRGRMSYRTLQRQFGLDDDYIADLKLELIEVQQIAKVTGVERKQQCGTGHSGGKGRGKHWHEAWPSWISWRMTSHSDISRPDVDDSLPV
jgi:hypothetical protein